MKSISSRWWHTVQSVHPSPLVPSPAWLKPPTNPWKANRTKTMMLTSTAGTTKVNSSSSKMNQRRPWKWCQKCTNRWAAALRGTRRCSCYRMSKSFQSSKSPTSTRFARCHRKLHRCHPTRGQLQTRKGFNHLYLSVSLNYSSRLLRRSDRQSRILLFDWLFTARFFL